MRINLLPLEYRPHPRVTFLNLIILLAGVFLVLGAGYMAVNEYLRFNSLNAEIGQLQQRLDSYQQSLIEYQRFEVIKQQIDKKHQEIKNITGLYLPLPVILRSVAGAIPENVWLNKLEIKPDGKVIMGGQSIIFPIIGDMLNNINSLSIVQSSRLLNISTTEVKEYNEILYNFGLELETRKENNKNAKN
jgi:Tfp pilus assembly protein PilN